VSESKENLPFSVARNIKDTPEQEYRKSVQFDYNIVKMIKIQIQDNNLIVAEANKNKTVVILQKHNYDNTVCTFMWASKFDVINFNLVIA
jgi:hypothetical protein